MGPCRSSARTGDRHGAGPVSPREYPVSDRSIRDPWLGWCPAVSRMNYRGSYRKLAANSTSTSAMMAAVEVYNKPWFAYRDEVIVI